MNRINGISGGDNDDSDVDWDVNAPSLRAGGDNDGTDDGNSGDHGDHSTDP